MNHRIAYYITAHGFGHAVRSLRVIKELGRIAPDVEITIVSTIPSFLIAQNLGEPLPQRAQALDVGMVQLDNLRLDLEATLGALQDLYDRRQSLIEEELRFFQRERINAVVSDVAFLPFVAAARFGIPCVGLGNFTWAWIYQHYVAKDRRWRGLVDWVRSCYVDCELFLQLPMHGDCSACPRVVPVPLVGRRARRSRPEVREILGIREGLKCYLLSFTALELSSDALRRVEQLSSVVYLYRAPLALELANAYCVDGIDLSYADLVGAVDAVITKPGYGIVADCLVQGTAMIYTDRGDFPEYDILVREMSRQLPVVYLPSTDFYAGRWEEAFQDLMAAPRPIRTTAADGSQVSAHAILEHIRGY
ncbi:MAG TPA: hypothetical protein DCZ69_13170 [Syntrophobacteraceae bacterium]|nr:hypothetical protein [Syntrophobacteraceae bacterium]